MKKINIKRTYYQFRHKYLTTNNIIVVIGLIIASSWIAGSLSVMERNYALQKELEDKSRQLVVAQLAKQSAELEKRYYQTEEYQELAVRQRLGLGTVGEKVLIITGDKDSQISINSSENIDDEVKQKTNFNQWIDFLSGKNIRNISK